MVQVNGFQAPGLRFVAPAGGLKGFQRQGMDQRKKANGAQFVGGGSASNPGSTFTVSAAQLAVIGAVPGDMFLFTAGDPGVNGPLNTTGFSGPGVVNYPGGQNVSCGVIWRPLTSADLTAGITVSGLSASAGEQDLTWNLYRNAAAISLRSTVPTAVGTATTVIIPGAVPTAKALGFVAIFAARDSSPNRTGPVGWNLRVQNQTAPSFANSTGVWDLLDASAYSGADVADTNEASNSDGHIGFLLELQAT